MRQSPDRGERRPGDGGLRSDGQSARDGRADPERRQRRAALELGRDDVAAGSGARPSPPGDGLSAEADGRDCGDARQHGRRGPPARGRNAGGNRGHLQGFGARIRGRRRLVPGLLAGKEYRSFMLDEGEVFQVWSGGDGQDLSGTEISANQPVAVFSGNITTTYGRTGRRRRPVARHGARADATDCTLEPQIRGRRAAAAGQRRATRCSVRRARRCGGSWRRNDDTKVEFTAPIRSRPVHANIDDEGGRGDRVDG